MKDEEILIPDEYILDYSLSQEEQKKQWEKYCYDRRKAWQALSDDDKELSDSKNSWNSMLFILDKLKKKVVELLKLF